MNKILILVQSCNNEFFEQEIKCIKETYASNLPSNIDFKFYNLYGPTECTIITTAFPVDKLYDRVPIGKGLYNTKLYVVDKYGRRVPPCVPGELWVAGHGVSRGYLNRPEQNEKVFIKNPFTNEKGYERVYRTGDIVRFLPGGNIDFVGRKLRRPRRSRIHLQNKGPIIRGRIIILLIKKINQKFSDHLILIIWRSKLFIEAQHNLAL